MSGSLQAKIDIAQCPLGWIRKNELLRMAARRDECGLVDRGDPA